MQIKGKVMSVRVRKDDGWSVFSIIAESGEHHNVTGKAEVLNPQMKVTIEGEFTTSKWGRQIKASSISPGWGEDDRGTEALRAMLASGFVKGIGPVTANAVVDRFGIRALDILDDAINGDTKDLMSISGVGPKTIELITTSWRERRGNARAVILSLEVGLSITQARSILKKFGGETADTILHKPYRLTQARYVNWEDADRVASIKLPGRDPIPHDSVQRYAAAVHEVIRVAHDQKGHMGGKIDAILEAAKELAVPGVPGFENKIRQHLDEEGLAIHGDILTTADLLEVEYETARRIKDMIGSGQPPIAKWDDYAGRLDEIAGFALSDDQREAIKLLLENPVAVLTGGPGTGKSTIMRVFLEIASQQGKSATLCAFTGKAADRLSETTGRPAATLHRTLGIEGREARYNIMTDILAVDEASMNDAFLMHTTVMACEPKYVRLVIIGDVDQLPPVGPGNPLRDMIDSGVVPVARLVNIHRQADGTGGIITLAHNVNNGYGFLEQQYADAQIVTISNNDEIWPTVDVYVAALVRNLGSVRKVQVLTPVNGHAHGQEELNRQLQAKYNHGGGGSSRHGFREGDPVIHVHNNYEMTDSRGEKRSVMNGMTGHVTAVRPDHAIEEMSEWDNTSGRKWLVAVKYDQFDDEIEYDGQELQELRLAYAITVHKSQGSEYDVVVGIVPQLKWPGFMNRPLPYTMITRAKKHLILVTVQDSLHYCAGNARRDYRITCLRSLLQEEVK